jgi:hypothetical protein
MGDDGALVLTRWASQLRRALSTSPPLYGGEQFRVALCQAHRVDAEPQSSSLPWDKLTRL